MPLYEHVLIARQDLSNTQAEGLIEHFSTVLADNGGKVVDNEYWGVRTLAYKINKNRKGHYAFLKSDAPAAAVPSPNWLCSITASVDQNALKPTASSPCAQAARRSAACWRHSATIDPISAP